MRPERLTVRNNGQTLILQWPDGRAAQLDAARLWADCPSSRARRRRIDGGWQAAPNGIRITAVDPIGLYGVNIAFSDGHDRGIYPWAFLNGLVSQPATAPQQADSPPHSQEDQP